MQNWKLKGYLEFSECEYWDQGGKVHAIQESCTYVSHLVTKPRDVLLIMKIRYLTWNLKYRLCVCGQMYLQGLFGWGILSGFWSYLTPLWFYVMSHLFWVWPSWRQDLLCKICFMVWLTMLESTLLWQGQWSRKVLLLGWSACDHHAGYCIRLATLLHCCDSRTSQPRYCIRLVALCTRQKWMQKTVL